MADDRKSKRGPKPIEAGLLRSNCVSTRLNDQELRILDSQRGEFFRGEWLRMAALEQLPHIIPENNRLSYSELGRIGSNLNQIARRLNERKIVEIAEVKAILDELRLSLLGAR